MKPERVVVIGAGIGGLTAAALLAKAGAGVTVLESHTYPGGCAGTFYHKGYRFDAGATLAAGFEPGGGMARLADLLGVRWPVEPAEIAMRVHLPDGATVTRWTAAEAWRDERLTAFGSRGERFWRWQEDTADLLWTAALAGMPWPPQSLGDLVGLGAAGAAPAAAHLARLPGVALDAVRPAAARLPAGNRRLAAYVDGQLLISAQTVSAQANALYAAASLDMPRRGIGAVRGGIGRLAETLAAALQRQGGQVHYRQRAVRVQPGRSGAGEPAWVVATNRQAVFGADAVLFNLPPWDAAALLGQAAPPRLQQAALPQDGWGAFVVYAGLDARGLRIADPPLHSQVLLADSLGEGNSVFLSLSLADDPERSPAGRRALTISTHTRLDPWWELWQSDREAYEARKAAYTERVLAAAEVALPGLTAAVQLVLPGTPVSFQRFTGRSRGWVGGFPQTHLLRAWGPRLGRNLWLVGDSIFPGQSVLATALGGTRVARGVRQIGDHA